MTRDSIQGAFWIALGLAILYASWTMDRLERLGAPAFTAPGLVPGLLGLVIFVLGVVLALRNRTAAAARFEIGNTVPVLVLCLGYAAGLVGRMPFWLATFVFVSAFIAIFEYPERRRMALAPVYGAATSVVVTYLFETIFLVQLP